MSRAERPLAYRPPTTAPMLVPAVASIGTRICSSTFSTPMCAVPRAPPPESTRPMRGRWWVSSDAGGSGVACASVMAGAARQAARNRLSARRRDTTARVELTRRRIPALSARACPETRRPRTPSQIMAGMSGHCLVRRVHRASGAQRARHRSQALRTVSALSIAVLSSAALAQAPGSSDWGYYGGDALGQHFSTLDQINRGNVARLAPAWTYRTGELGAGFASARKLTFEATPVIAFGLLYLETATNVVIALDPESGRERWRFDPHIDRARRYSEASARGVSLWSAGGAAGGGACRHRVFTGTLDARLLALDADTGRPCGDFGTGGQVDLTRGLRIRDTGEYLVASPPAVFGKVVIVGSAIGDNRASEVERGVIRAYDAESGAQLWSFDPLPDSPAHPAAADWKLEQAQSTGAGNAWGVMTVDQEHGLVLVPTGSASPDYYGGQRLGSDRFADSLLALDARSGRLVWQQQLVHHDLWDYDLAAQPVLGDVVAHGAPVPA